MNLTKRSFKLQLKKGENKIKNKKTKNGFMNGVIALMFSQVIIKIVGLIYKLYLTNKENFGDQGNAIYSAGFQIYSIFLTISSIGVPNAISKLVSAKLAVGDNKGAYRIFKIAFSIFGIIGFFGSSMMFINARKIANNFLQIPEAELTILALSPSVFLVSISSVLRGYFNGRENISITANSQSLEQIFKTLFTIIIVERIALCNNTAVIAAGASIATTIATIFSLVYLYKYFIQKKKEFWKEVFCSKKQERESVRFIIKSVLQVCIPIAIVGLLSVTTKTIDAFTIVRILKKNLTESEATIQYGILSGKIDTLITLPFSFNIAFATALVPAISSAIAKKQEYIAKKRIEFSILATILIGLLCTTVMFVLPEQIINILFPNANQGAAMLKISSLCITFVVLIQTINGAMQGMGKVNSSVIAFGVGVIVKLLLNLILIPIKKIGIYGAIISSLCCHIVTFVICFLQLKKCIYIKMDLMKNLIKPITAAVLMGMVLHISYLKLVSKFENMIIPFLISLVLGCGIYIICIILLKILSKEEIFMIPYGQKTYRKIKSIKNIGNVKT